MRRGSPGALLARLRFALGHAVAPAVCAAGPRGRRADVLFLCDIVRLIFGILNPTQTTPGRRMPDGPADID